MRAPGRLPTCPVMQKRAVCPTHLHLTRFLALALSLHILEIASHDGIHTGYLSSKVCVAGALFHTRTLCRQPRTRILRQHS